MDMIKIITKINLSRVIFITIVITIGNLTGQTGYSLRFYGNGVDDIDRVKIPIDDPERPIDIGSEDFTIEFWMKAFLEENSGTVSTGNDGWITGNSIFDRDIYGAGDFGDFGISMGNISEKGVIAFGVNNGSEGETIVGTLNVADGQWHHVAVTRRFSDGLLSMYVDGQLDAQTDGPDGDISYRNGRSTSYANDPFLVLGAEKHDAGSAYPSFSGWLDEIRISNVIRYNDMFIPVAETFTADENTIGLYHLDEGSGNIVNDVSGAEGGPSNGLINFGGSPQGPEWVNDTIISSIESKEQRQNHFKLYKNYPNPFNPKTIIKFEILNDENSISLLIYNSAGQIVKNLYMGFLNSGLYTLEWYGDDDHGMRLPSGLYFINLRSGRISLTDKILLIR